MYDTPWRKGRQMATQEVEETEGRVKVTLSFDPGLVARIDDVARRMGLSRPAALRYLVLRSVDQATVSGAIQDQADVLQAMAKAFSNADGNSDSQRPTSHRKRASKGRRAA